MIRTNLLAIFAGDKGTVWLTTLLLDTALKATALLLLTLLLAWLLRRASAATRHLLWTAAILGLLLLPVGSVALPAWQILPAWLTPTLPSTALPSPRVTTPLTLEESEPLATEQNLLPLNTANPNLKLKTAPSHESLPTHKPSNAATPTLAANPVTSPTASIMANHTAPVLSSTCYFTSVINLCWLLGCLLLLLPLLMTPILLRRLRRRAIILNYGPWPGLLDQLRTTLGLRRRVMLLQSSTRPIPLTFGFIAPKILLPSDANQWPADRSRVVLLHELAHIKRWDCLIHLLTRMVCACYWFHPLAWVAVSRLSVERERACDDLVLNTGTKSSDYANELLTLASSLHPHHLTAYAALAMARPSTLEGRLLAILDSKRNRKSLTVASIVAALVIVLAVFLPVAAIKGQSATTNHATTKPAVEEICRTNKLPHPAGFEVEILGITQPSTQGESIWLVDGSASPHQFDGKFKQFMQSNPPGLPERHFLIKIKDLPAEASLTFSLNKEGSGWFNYNQLIDGLKPTGVWELATMIQPNDRRGTLKVGIATTPWIVTGDSSLVEVTPDKDFDRPPMGQADTAVWFSKPKIRTDMRTEDPVIKVRWFKDLGDDNKFVALDTDGKSYDGHIITSYTYWGTGGQAKESIVSFPNIKLEQIKSVRLLTRAYQWVEFKNIALQPAVPTTAPVSLLQKSIQTLAQDECQKVCDSNQAEAAYVVIYDAATRKMLAAAKYPPAATEPAAFRFPPGNAIAPFIMAAALDKQLVKSDTVVIEKPVDSYQSQQGHDFQEIHGWAASTASQVISRASKVGIAMLADKLGMDEIQKKLTFFGFELPADTKGLDPARIATGDDFTVTPIQMTQAYTTLAQANHPVQVNGIVMHIQDPNIPSANALNAMLRETVVEGSAKVLKSNNLKIFGKTGNSMVASVDASEPPHYYASFFGSIALDHPTFTVGVVVVVGDPETHGRMGGTLAAPAAGRILAALDNLAPDSSPTTSPATTKFNLTVPISFFVKDGAIRMVGFEDMPSFDSLKFTIPTPDSIPLTINKQEGKVRGQMGKTTVVGTRVTFVPATKQLTAEDGPEALLKNAHDAATSSTTMPPDFSTPQKTALTLLRAYRDTDWATYEKGIRSTVDGKKIMQASFLAMASERDLESAALSKFGPQAERISDSFALPVWSDFMIESLTTGKPVHYQIKGTDLSGILEYTMQQNGDYCQTKITNHQLTPKDISTVQIDEPTLLVQVEKEWRAQLKWDTMEKVPDDIAKQVAHNEQSAKLRMALAEEIRAGKYQTYEEACQAFQKAWEQAFPVTMQQESQKLLPTPH